MTTPDKTSGVVYPPFKKNRTFAGIRGAYWPRIAVVAIIGIVITGLLGSWTYMATEETTTIERNRYITQYEDMREAMEGYEQAVRDAGTTDTTMLDLTAEERELIASAQSNGITASTTDEELEARAPKTKEVETERIWIIWRILIFVVIPVTLVAGWHMELRGNVSLHDILQDVKRFFHRQRIACASRNDFLWNER